MKILSIDTTSMLGSVALSDGRKLVAEKQQRDPKTYSTVLMPVIADLLSEARWDKKSIEAIAVAVGPGSFTGLRIGLAAAKGLSLGLGVPVIGVSSLRSLALNGDGISDTVAPLIDARRGEMYIACFKFSEGGMTVVIDECVLPPEDVVRRLRSVGKNIALVGDGVLAYRDFLMSKMGGDIIIPEEESILPRAHNLALLAMERLERGERDDLAALAPNYIRHSDAEIGFYGHPLPNPLPSRERGG